MPAARPSPFETLETTFRLLSSGPEPLAVDGRRLGQGLPGRVITVRELGVMLVCHRVTAEVQRVVLDELIYRATQGGSGWVVGLAGVLLPGLRRVAALTQPDSAGAMSEVEAELLGRYRAALARSHAEVAEFASDLLRVAQGLSSHIGPGTDECCDATRGEPANVGSSTEILHWPSVRSDRHPLSASIPDPDHSVSLLGWTGI
jgi:hypothetical protein